jgi:hypothetical protein
MLYISVRFLLICHNCILTSFALRVVIKSTNCLCLSLITCPFIRQNRLSATSKQPTLHHHDKAKLTKLAHVADNASDSIWKVLSPNFGRGVKYRDENRNNDLANKEEDASGKASRLRQKLPEHKLHVRCAAESS